MGYSKALHYTASKYANITALWILKQLIYDALISKIRVLGEKAH